MSQQGQLGGTRSWEGTEPGQLTTADHRDISDHTVSCPVCKAGGRLEGRTVPGDCLGICPLVVSFHLSFICICVLPRILFLSLLFPFSIIITAIVVIIIVIVFIAYFCLILLGLWLLWGNFFFFKFCIKGYTARISTHEFVFSVCFFSTHVCLFYSSSFLPLILLEGAEWARGCVVLSSSLIKPWHIEIIWLKLRS